MSTDRSIIEAFNKPYREYGDDLFDAEETDEFRTFLRGLDFEAYRLLCCQVSTLGYLLEDNVFIKSSYLQTISVCSHLLTACDVLMSATRDRDHRQLNQFRSKLEALYNAIELEAFKVKHNKYKG
jgi:hypothetical protein